LGKKKPVVKENRRILVELTLSAGAAGLGTV
jgi:hypothetical protein